MTWTPDQIAILRDMAERGYSGTEIAQTLRKSRNAVAGMAHRNKIKLKGIGGNRRNPTPENPSQESVAMEKLVQMPPVVQIAPVIEKTAPVKVSKTTHTTLFDRTSDQCPYIIGEISTNSTVCGMPVAENCVYCLPHHTACHTDRALKQINLAA